MKQCSHEKLGISTRATARLITLCTKVFSPFRRDTGSGETALLQDGKGYHPTSCPAYKIPKLNERYTYTIRTDVWQAFASALEKAFEWKKGVIALLRRVRYDQ